MDAKVAATATDLDPASQALASDRTHSTGYARYVVVLLSLVYVLNYVDRVALSVLAPSIKADLNLSDSQLGMMIGFAFSLFYAICGIPVARWADRGIRRNIIVITLTTWSVMTALSGAAQNLWQLFAARVGVGIGEAGCVPTGASIITDYVPPQQRPAVFAGYTFGSVVGVMLGLALTGWLAEAIGWRLTFVVLGLPGIALAAVVRLTLREPARGCFDGPHENSAGSSLVETLKLLSRNRLYRLLVIFFSANAFVNFGLTQWWPSLYARVTGLSISAIGVQLGLAIGVGSAVGLLIGGLMATKVARRDVRLPLLISAAAIVLCIPAALGSLFVESVSGSTLLVALTSVFWNVPAGPAVAAMYGAVMPRMRATAGAFQLFFTAILGLGLGPVCIGVLSDVLAPSLGTQSLRYALLAPICLLPPMAFTLCAAAMQSQRQLRSGPDRKAVG